LDGKSLLTMEYNKVGVWEVENVRRVGELDHGKSIVTCAAFAPDGRTVLTGAADGMARLWDWNNPKEAREHLSAGNWIEAVAFFPDGRHFATGGQSGSILVWEVASRQPVMSLEHLGGVNTLAVSPDGRLLLSGGEDRTGRLWDLTGDRS